MKEIKELKSELQRIKELFTPVNCLQQGFVDPPKCTKQHSSCQPSKTLLNFDTNQSMLVPGHTGISSSYEDRDDVAELLTRVELLIRVLVKLENEKRDLGLKEKDFRPSLIENSNYDGTMVWKIPQFCQRMSDAHSGKYTSIFSLPFYTSRYGYKMCLRLYILGDGIGKNNYMSLFFVIMRGEFDNILQ